MIVMNRKRPEILNQIFRILLILDRILAKISLFLIKIYQKTLSPDKGLFSFYLRGKVCSHIPHCSEYWKKILKRYWFFNGLPKIIDRILHCLPSMNKIYDPEHYRVVFISSAPIWVPFLEELMNDDRFEIIGVVTQPDKPVGRGLNLQENIIKTQAKTLGIAEKNIKTPTKINPDKSLEGKNFFDWLKGLKPDYLVVIAYWKIIPQSILDIPIFWPINVHGSLLPKYRWASPIQTIFLNKEEESWITIMHMDSGMDTWDIISQKTFNIPFDWTCLDSIKHMQKIGPKFLNQTLRDYAKNKIKAQKQDEKQVIDCKKIEKSDWEIEVFSDSLETIYAKYRGYYLWPKIHFILDDKKVIIEKLILDKTNYEQKSEFPLFSSQWELHSAVKEILLKPEWKKTMDWISFKNGYLKKTL